MSTDTVDRVDPIETVTQRVTPAAAAPRPALTAASSVFALGAKAAAAAAAAPAQAPASAAERALKVMQGHKRVSSAQLAAAMGIGVSRATQLIHELVRAGDVLPDGKDGRTPFYCTRTRASAEFKAGASVMPARKTKASTPAAQPAPQLPAIAPQPSPIQVLPAPEPQLLLGLFNSGEIVIERGEQSLRLTPRQARQLVDWALRADTLLPAEA